jgi:uncharacterized protein (DUF488 family)
VATAYWGVLMTVGHGTVDAPTLSSLLLDAGVEVVVDVRSYPGSRRHPQFGREAMETWLPEAGLTYQWEKSLGGRRRPVPGSRHLALRHDAFRAYADHMETEEFGAALDRVLGLAADRPTTVLCAESVWWRCHRRLLADTAVLTRGAEVRHLFHDGRAEPHRPTPEARVEEGLVVYDLGVTPPLEVEPPA